MKSWNDLARGAATVVLLGAVMVLNACSLMGSEDKDLTALSATDDRVVTDVTVGLPAKDCAEDGTCAEGDATKKTDSTAGEKTYMYIVGPGDNLSINVWRNPDLSTSAVVRPDGMVTIPLIEDLPVSGRTPTQIARDIENLLVSYIKEPIVSVTVSGFVGPYSEQIRVVGEAANPQALPYRENMSLLDLMIAVGGLTDYAAGNRAVLVRLINDEQKEYRLRLKDLVKKGDIAANAYLQPGDIIIIPESWF